MSSVELATYGVHDEVLGTLVLIVHDPLDEVARIDFFVTDGSGLRSAAQGADDSPTEGVHEKRVLLDPASETLVEAEVVLNDAAQTVLRPEARSFPRTTGLATTLVQGERAERGTSVEIGAGLALARTTDGLRPVLSFDPSLSLLDFREVERTATEVVFRWTRGARVAQVEVFDRLYAQPLTGNPWPQEGDTPIILPAEDEYRAQLPPIGSTRFLQLEPRDENHEVGPVQRVKLDGLAPALPFFEGFQAQVSSEPPSVSLLLEVHDPMGHGGTLEYWLPVSETRSADPNAAPSGSLVIAAGEMPKLLGPASVAAFGGIPVAPGSTLGVYLRFTTDDERGTGKQRFEVASSLDTLVDPLGKLRAESVHNALVLAEKYRPYHVAASFSAFSGLTPEALETDRAFASDTLQAYRWDTAAGQWVPDDAVPAVSYAPILRAGAISASGVIADGVIVPGHLDVANLREISPDLGIIVSGKLKSSDDRSYIALSEADGAHFIHVANAAGEVTLSVDHAGNAVFKGTLDAATGTFDGDVRVGFLESLQFLGNGGGPLAELKPFVGTLGGQPYNGIGIWASGSAQAMIDPGRPPRLERPRLVGCHDRRCPGGDRHLGYRRDAPERQPRGHPLLPGVQCLAAFSTAPSRARSSADGCTMEPRRGGSWPAGCGTARAGAASRAWARTRPRPP